jgi:hypothetical protein
MIRHPAFDGDDSAIARLTACAILVPPEADGSIGDIDE